MSSTTDSRSADDSVLVSVDPSSGEVIAEHRVDDADAVRAAVADARVAARTWAGMSFAERKRALQRWAAYLTGHADEFSALMHQENGKPLDDAFLELSLTVGHIDWAAKHAEKTLRTRTVRPGALMANFAASVEYRPLGVVGVIGPWNYPTYTPNGSIAYALAAGNTVVFKPSEYTTTIGNYYAESFSKANPELPQHILRTVNGYGATGAALVTAGVDKIAFTGSTATGKRIMAAAAETLTPILLECGGKDAAIVAADADVAAAARDIAWGAAANSGQTCVGIERVYVLASVRERFLDELRKNLAQVRAGSEPGAHYGPMTMPSQVAVVREHIEDALKHGGTALVGGPDSVRAPFIDPVVLVDVDEDSLAVQEETFGPTVTVRSVDSLDEAIALANGTRYGLASSVYSARHGVEIARQLRAGATSINSVIAFGAISALPFGGVGESGIGRIHGEEGLREFVRPHSIARQRFAIPGMALLALDRTPAAMAMARRAVRMLYGRAPRR
ncbi:aldehyde dehydrogenase family protein [Nocardia stercoris]|uniref:aldehyde dehydrogenase family protein n=1 Tax=Nocardia stercoris TaxID=2483361 RepID=UPI001F391F2B|nr:aldehyde dehydrogenase family protein [Nocardia stercoris]